MRPADSSRSPESPIDPRVDLTLAIPAFNEFETLESVVRDALATLGARNFRFEILVVDDGSTDGTADLADRLARLDPRVRAFHHARNLGFTGAFRSCFEQARGRWLFLGAGDGQINAADVARFMDSRGDADVVYGFHSGYSGSPVRRLNSFMFNLFIRTLLRLRLRHLSGPWLYRTDLLRGIRFRSHARSAMMLPEVAYRLNRLGARFAGIPFTLHPRAGGVAKGAGLRMIVLTFFELLRLRAVLWTEVHVRAPRSRSETSA